MNDRNLNELLKAYATAPRPALPGSFAQDVLREIRLRKHSVRHGGTWISEFYALFFRPQLLMTSFSIAVLVGIASPAMMRPSSSTLAASSLNLDVFSRSMSRLPSGLLARAQ